MRVIILLYLFHMLLNSFEISSEQLDRDSTQLSLLPVNLNYDMVKSLNTQKFKILTSHYTLNHKNDSSKYNANYYINTKIYKNIDISLYNTQSSDNFYTKLNSTTKGSIWKI